MEYLPVESWAQIASYLDLVSVKNLQLVSRDCCKGVDAIKKVVTVMIKIPTSLSGINHAELHEGTLVNGKLYGWFQGKKRDDSIFIGSETLAIFCGRIVISWKFSERYTADENNGVYAFSGYHNSNVVTVKSR